MTSEELVILKAQRAALFTSIATGSNEMRDQTGKFIGYRPLNEMRSILASIDAEIAVAEGATALTTRSSRYRNTISTCKGL